MASERLDICLLYTSMPSTSWYGKLPDWQMGVTWLAATAIATVIYFVPMARLVQAMTH